MEALLVLLTRLLISYPTLLPLIFYLLVLTWYDVKHREIDDALILAGAPGVVASLVVYTLINGVRSLLTVGTFSSAVVGATLVATTYLLAKKGQMGSGDTPIIFLTALALLPYAVEFYGMVIPLVLVVMVLGATYVVAEVVMNVVHNVRRMGDFSEATADCGALEKAYYFLATRVFRSDEFRSLRFYFPVKHGGVRRLTAKVGFEPMEGSEYEVLGDVVLAIKGIPFVAMLLTGAVLATLLVTLFQPTC